MQHTSSILWPVAYNLEKSLTNHFDFSITVEFLVIEILSYSNEFNSTLKIN